MLQFFDYSVRHKKSLILKSYVNFWRKTAPFPKKLSNAFSKQFFTVFSENIAFSKKLSNKEIFSVYFLIKKVIFIFGVRWLWQSPSEPATSCCKRSWRGDRNISLLTQFLPQRFCFSLLVERKSKSTGKMENKKKIVKCRVKIKIPILRVNVSTFWK